MEEFFWMFGGEQGGRRGKGKGDERMAREDLGRYIEQQKKGKKGKKRGKN